MTGQPLIQRQTLPGPAVTVGDLTVRPQAQAIVLRWPSGGVVWNRPTAILVERGGHTERIPIVDVTRLAVLALAAFSVMVLAASIVTQSRRRREARANDLPTNPST